MSGVKLELTLTPLPGASITNACESAVRVATLLTVKVVIVFNGERLCAYPGTRAENLVEEYWKTRTQYGEQQV